MIEPEVAYMELDGLLELAENFLTHIVTTVLANHRADLTVIGRDISKLEAVIAPPTSWVPQVRCSLTVDPGKYPLHPHRSVISSAGAALLGCVISTGAAGEAERPPHFVRTATTRAHPTLPPLKLRRSPPPCSSEPSQKASSKPPRLRRRLRLTLDEDLHLQQPVRPPRHDPPLPRVAFKAFYMQPEPRRPHQGPLRRRARPRRLRRNHRRGSQRIDSYELLKSRIEEHNLPLAAFQWYLDLRRYGSVPHSGFGMGIERVVAWLCGLDHVRETIPFARTLNRIYP